MIALLAGAAATLVVGLGGLAFKWWLATRRSTEQKTADTAHAMLKDAANRVDPDDVPDRMRRGDF